MRRRNFLKTAGAAAITASGPAIIIPGRAQPKTLKILDWKGFDPPSYDEWFPKYVQAWGERNNTRVILDRLKFSEIGSRVTSEAAEQQGHDLVNFGLNFDAIIYQDKVIDLREVYEECEHRYGKPVDLAIRMGYDPNTKIYYNFILNYALNPIIYRRDLWDAVGKFPDTWEDVRLGGRHIKLVHGPAIGLGLGNDPLCRRNVESILFSFGSSFQDTENRPALKSHQTLEALKFFKALYEEAMTDDVLSWDNTSNYRALLAEEISLTLNPINLTRTGENLHLPVAAKLALARTPKGPVRRLGSVFINYTMGIWKFAENIDSARQFLVDWVGSSRQTFLASQFYHFPAYPQTIPDIAELLAADANAQPPDRYQLLADAVDWASYPAYPGYDNGARRGTAGSGLLQKMFANTATGKMTPEEALTQADQEVRRIYRKWQDLGKV
jgi:multiple sugar transport system substrate-binding protein